MNSKEEIFEHAAALPQSERAAYLDTACAGQAERRARIEALLRSHDSAGFMDAGETEARGPEHAEDRTQFQPEQGGERIGRYRLLQQIGEGGFGVVWMAEQVEPVTRRVALKIIKAGMDTKEVIARFEAERQALAMMDHPNIAKVFDAGTTGETGSQLNPGRPYFVMELVKGIPITKFCDEQELTTRQRLALFADVCSAINHAHQKGVIHRDIKPSNVMVALHGDKPVPKVIDFGIAKATHGRLTDKTVFTRFEQFVGTPAYMSPEQTALSELDVDTRSDIYALGILLYELLTGKPPFDTRSLISAGYEEMRRIIREVDPQKPSTRLNTVAGAEKAAIAKSRHVDPEQLGRLVEPDLDSIVMRCLEKDRSRRYETANGLALDVQRYLNHEPVRARPPTAGYRMAKFIRRHRVGVLAGVIVFTSLAAATAFSTWRYFLERDARRHAERAQMNEMQWRLRFEAEARVSDARFLFRNRDPEEGEKRLALVPALLSRMDPTHGAGIHARIGDLRAQQGRWRNSAEAYLRSIDAARDHFEHWHYGIPAMVRSGDMDHYRKLRAEMMTRFGGTADTRVAERLLKDCLIAPWPEADAARLKRLADVALSGAPKHWTRGYCLFVKGLADFRSGDHRSAADHVNQSLERFGDDRNRNVQAYMILAMASHQQGDKSAALSAFKRGREYAAQSLPGETQLFGYVGWNDWVIAHCLMQEASALLETAR